MIERYGLIGTITHDTITTPSGEKILGLGGVLYQAAVLCGLGKSVSLFTHLGVNLASSVEKVTAEWQTLDKGGIRLVPGPGNLVHLDYPPQGERIEILKSVVPPLSPEIILPELSGFNILVLIINSGFDLVLEDWKKIRDATTCPIWLDIHSLLLTKQLHIPRRYHPLEVWREWTKGVDYIQANTTEVAALLGNPDQSFSDDELREFAALTFQNGTQAMFIAKGEKGVLVLTPNRLETVSAGEAQQVADTTGCGDVFCAGAVIKLLEGLNPFEAAAYGIRLAAAATGVRGIEATYTLIQTKIKSQS